VKAFAACVTRLSRTGYMKPSPPSNRMGKRPSVKLSKTESLSARVAWNGKDQVEPD
jgi:hypothetical protein